VKESRGQPQNGALSKAVSKRQPFEAVSWFV